MFNQIPVFFFIALLSGACVTPKMEEYKAEMYFHSKEKCFDGVLTVLGEMKIPISEQDAQNLTVISKLGEVNVIATGNASYASRTVETAKYFIKVTGSQYVCKVDVYNLIVWNGHRMLKMDQLAVEWAASYALRPLFERLELHLNEKDYK